jgi:ERCC4-related helicase
VLYGWRVTYKNSVKLATRSESKSLIDAITKIVNDISDMSLTYWLKSSNKKSSTAKKLKMHRYKKQANVTASESAAYLMNVLAKVNQAYKLIDILQTRGIYIESSFMSDVIENATLDCERIDSFTKEERASKAQEVVNSCMLVTKSLYDKFQYFYPPINNDSILSKVRRNLMIVDEWHNSLK